MNLASLVLSKKQIQINHNRTSLKILIISHLIYLTAVPDQLVLQFQPPTSFLPHLLVGQPVWFIKNLTCSIEIKLRLDLSLSCKLKCWITKRWLHRFSCSRLQLKSKNLLKPFKKYAVCNNFYDHTAFSKGTVFLSDDLTVCTIPENLTIDNNSSNPGSKD